MIRHTNSQSVIVRGTVSARRGLVAVGIVAGLALTTLAPALASAAPSANAPCDLSCVISFGNARIAERVTALGTLNSKVSTALSKGRITQDEATPLQNDVSTDTSGLQALQTKLDGESDTKAARQDVALIYSQFRVYAVVLPRDYRRLALDMMQTLDGKLTGAEASIEKRIDAAPASERPQLQATFDDYKAKLGEAEGQIDAANGQIAVLTPQNYNTARSTYDTAFTDYKNDESTAHGDVKAAGADLHSIVQTLKGSHGTAAAATPSA